MHEVGHGVMVRGRPGLARDLAQHLVGSGALGSVEPSSHAPVMVLIDPEPDQWREAALAGARVVLVTVEALDEAAVVEAVLRGADAVLVAGSPPMLILEAIDTVRRSGAFLDPWQVRALAKSARSQRHAEPQQELRLSPREREILASITMGHSVKQTASALRISAKTVENLQSRLYRRLGVRNRAQAVSRAHALGVLAPAS